MTHQTFARFVLAGCVAVMLVLFASTGPAAADGDAEAAAPAEVHTSHQYVYIVYLNPADRECLPDYEERLDRVMTTIQTWYRDEMKRNGSAR